MAEIAQERAEHAQISRLAAGIIEAQTAEIDDMGQMHERLFDEPIGGADHGTMGISAHEMAWTWT